MKKNFIIILLGVAMSASCANPNEGTKVVKNRYSVSIAAEGANSSNASPQTRVEDVDGTHHWSVGDKVGLYVFREGNLGGIVANLNEDYNGQDLLSGFFSYILISPDFFEAVIENIGMTGLHEESTPSANFEGTLTLEDISLFDPSSVYDYASYYPYIESNDRVALFLSLYTLERETTVRSNTFPGHTVRLFGTMYGYMPPITWLDEGGEQHAARAGIKVGMGRAGKKRDHCHACGQTHAHLTGDRHHGMASIFFQFSRLNMVPVT